MQKTKKHTMKANKNKQGFTLMELLVVVGIIVLLASIALPAVNRARRLMYEAEAKKMVKQLKHAADNYIVEYKRPPIPLEKMTTDTWPDENNSDDAIQDIIRVLQGTNVVETSFGDIHNRDRIIFLDVPDAEAGKEILDPWDQPYILIIDANQDGHLTYEGKKYPVEVLAVCKGKDGQRDTGDDMMSNQ